MGKRKHIRLHELQVGMFVEELDNQPRSADGTFRPFLISTPAQIAWLMRAKVMSVVINVQKGLDLHHRAPQPGDFDRQAVEASLLAHFSPKDLEAARHSIAETKPDIRNGHRKLNGNEGRPLHRSISPIMLGRFSPTGSAPLNAIRDDDRRRCRGGGCGTGWRWDRGWRRNAENVALT